MAWVDGECDREPGNEIGWQTCLNLGLGLGIHVMGTLGLGGSSC